jgi:hypothetical protein
VLDEPPTGTIYAPMTQAPAGVLPFLVNGVSFVARGHDTSDRIGALLTRAVRAPDATIAVSAARPLAANLDATLAPRRRCCTPSSLACFAAARRRGRSAWPERWRSSPGRQ